MHRPHATEIQNLLQLPSMENVPNTPPLIEENRKKNQSMESTPLSGRRKLLTNNGDVIIKDNNRKMIGRESSNYLKEFKN